jgi:hypothetical protein
MGFVVLKLLRQRRMGVRRLGQDEHTAGVAIQAVHHPDARFSRGSACQSWSTRLKIRLGQIDDGELRGIPAVWDHQQAGGLIEHQEVLIFMQHIEVVALTQHIVSLRLHASLPGHYQYGTRPLS